MQFLNRHMTQTVMILFVAVGLVACGGGEREARNRANDDQSASVAQSSGSASADQATVNVVARDFEFSLDAASVAAGTVTFIVSNKGSMPHDFAITIDGQRHKTEMIKPGDSAVLTVDLAPGSYEYICTIPGHAILGMKGSLTIE